MRRLADILAFLLLLFLAACSKTPDGVLPPDEMADLMADLHKGDAVIQLEAQRYRADTMRRQLRLAILSRHGVSEATLDSSLSWYAHNLPEYVKVYDGVVARLEDDLEQNSKAGIGVEAPARIVIDSDSASVWPLTTSRRFARGSASDFMVFSIPADRNWQPGDVYEWRSRFTAASGVASVILAADYVDGTTEYVSDGFSGDGWRSLKLYLDPDKRASRVYGSFYYNVPSVSYVDSISLIRTRHLPADSLMRSHQRVVRQPDR